MNKLILVFALFLSLGFDGYSQQDDVDLFMKEYGIFFRKMNDNFVDEIQLEDFWNQNKKNDYPSIRSS